MPKRKPRLHPRLRVGELVMHDGEPHTVVRVSAGAAYLAPGDWTTEPGAVLKRDWMRLKAVSLHSAVERVG